MLVNVQLLRFWAALAVVLYHMQPHLVAAGGPQQGVFGLFRLFGYAGVDVFFVISGFIIWHTTESLRGGRWSLDFAYRRATRIYTGYWPYFLLALAVIAVYAPQRLGGLALTDSFLLLHAPLSELVLPVAWTLTYELYFYTVFMLLLWFSTRVRLFAVAGLLATVAAIQGAAWAGGQVYAPAAYAEVSVFYRFFASPFCLEFLAGCLLAAGYRRVRPAPLWLLGGFLVLLAAGVYVQEAVVMESLAKGFHRPYRVLLFGGAAFFLVWAMLAWEQQGRIWAPGYGVFLGAISYSLYLCHIIFLDLVYFIGLRDWIAGAGYAEVWYAGFGAVIVGYSALHYRWVERPLRRLSRALRARYIDRWLGAD